MVQDLEKLVISLQYDIRSAASEMRKFSGIHDAEARKIERRQKQLQAQLKSSVSGIASSFMAPLGGLVGSIGGMLGAHEIVKYAEDWHAVENRLRVAGYAGLQLEGVLDGVYQAAQRTSQNMGPFSEVFAKFAQARAGVGATTNEVVRFTEALALGAKIQGSSIGQADGVITPLMVAFQSGKFNARGVRSMFAEMPVLAQAAARGIDVAGGSVKKLFALVSENKISPTQFFQGVLKGFDLLEETANRKEATVGAAMTRLDNSMGRYVGTASASIGASTSLAGAIDYLGSHIDDVVRYAEILAGALAPAGLALAARGSIAAVTGLWAIIAANPLMTVAIVVAALATALVVYADKIDKSAEAIKREKKAHEELNAVLEEAKKNHNQIEADKAAETKARLLAAQATLKEAEAQARLNLQQANSVQAGRGIIGSGSPTAVAAADFIDPGKYRAELEQIEAAQIENNLDLSKLGRLKVVPNASASFDPDPGNTKGAALAERRRDALTQTADEARAASADLGKSIAAANEQAARGTSEYGVAVVAGIKARGDADVAEVEARKDRELAALDRMGKGWKDYADAKANVEQASADRIQAIRARQAGELSEVMKESAKEVDTAEQEAFDKRVEQADALRDDAERVGLAGLKGAKSFKEAIAATAEELAAMTLRLQVLEPWIEATFGKRGTPLQIGGNQVGGGGGGFKYGGVPSTIWDLIPKFAAGTNSAPGGLSLLGEQGPELVDLPPGTGVTPAGPSARALQRMSSRSLAFSAPNTINVYGNADHSSLAIMSAMLAQHRKDVARIVDSRASWNQKITEGL